MDQSAGLWVRRFAGEPPPLVALHGFTQTGAMFAELAELLSREILAPDLPGHGRSAGYPVTFASAVAGVVEVLASVGSPVPLLGYSQGGRVALAVALERPELVSHLVLVSTSLGIEDKGERGERLHADEVLAAELEREGLAAFVDRWLSHPMFAGLSRRGAAWQDADAARRLENTPGGLAAALVGMGQGAQPYLGGRLRELGMPVMMVVGGQDEKYLPIADAMIRSLEHGTLRIVRDAGHAVIGEQPRVTAELTTEFFTGPI
jgi:2-succinyl-6-hydroxy-2,4-cyclohexadiene-1-carboxylate synthase